jgi:pilus assembly protein CpaF
VHANSAADVPARLEALAALGGMTRPALHAQLASALHAVIQVIRDDEGLRRVSEIAVLVRDPATGLVRADQAVQFTGDGRAVRGPGGAQLERLLDR